MKKNNAKKAAALQMPQLPPIKKGTFGRLMKFLFKHYKVQLIIVFICLAFSAIAGVIASIFIKRITDEAITPGLTQGLDAVWTKLVSLIIQMGIIYLLGVICSHVYSRLLVNITQGALHKMRTQIFDRMETLPIKYFDTHAHGDIMSLYTNDVDTVRQLVNQSLPQIFSAALSITMVFFTMLSFSFWLTIVVIACLVAMFFVTKKIGGASSRFMVAQQHSLAREEGFIEEMMNGSKIIKVFCHEETSKRDFEKLNEQLFHDSEKAHRFGNILMPILGNIGNLMYVLIAFVGSMLVFFNVPNFGLESIGSGANVITFGIIISFLSMSRQLSVTISQVSQEVSMVAMGMAGASRVFELLDEESEADEGYVTLVHVNREADGSLTECEERTDIWAWKHFHKADGTTTYIEVTGDIVLDQVDFGYVPEKNVLSDVSVYAKPGQKIALVGATGAGKTTITNLLNRFYDIQDGKIRYDGINVTKIRKPDLRRALGIVLQDTNLFTGTVLDNIRYGRLDATDEECIAAAKLANADDFITRLPNGYHTPLSNNGANLSQGQRQLLSIARAAVADAPVMILDEATSSIDTRTEALVQDGMDKLMHGRTVFVIAHRLSTIRNSDAIMVLDQGRIIERGSHEKLLSEKGTYYKLYTGAFELE